jgi:hypothetical protein
MHTKQLLVSQSTWREAWERNIDTSIETSYRSLPHSPDQPIATLNTNEVEYGPDRLLRLKDVLDISLKKTYFHAIGSVPRKLGSDRLELHAIPFPGSCGSPCKGDVD